MIARVGNLHQDQNGNLLKVSATDEKDNRVIYTVVDRLKFPLPDGWQAQPLIITDELLEKSDFVNAGGLEEGIFRHRKHYRFKLIRLPDGTYQFNAHIPIILKEFHRLQNLFEATSNEELITQL